MIDIGKIKWHRYSKHEGENIVFHEDEMEITDEFYPAVSLQNKDEHLVVNFGSKEFKVLN